ncbi:general stress protein [Pontibacillus chungwhensis BH030062]|uniref:General stress protein n=1 Tax=Pontibacillus chungwhensis BH030062 TaxID=1385513 RepID=A0A0A2UZD0_9BACI|nr:DUF948 domain-containing protein [Pontibacillus chungwhensis]KGP92148.1 general stress protein [Pontibacillus chungwhensis BH030062]
MTLVGIGVLIIGIAFAIISIFVARTLNNLAHVLNGVDETVKKLPEQLDGVMNQTAEVLGQSKDTLADVNEKIRTLSPLFYIIGDVGESSRKLTSSLVDMTSSLKKNTKDGRTVVNEENLRGLYGAIAFSYFLTKRKRAMKDALEHTNQK